MLFSKDTGPPVCVCKQEKKQICHTYLQHGWHFGKSKLVKEFLNYRRKINYRGRLRKEFKPGNIIYKVEGSAALGRSNPPPKL